MPHKDPARAKEYQKLYHQAYRVKNRARLREDNRRYAAKPESKAKRHAQYVTHRESRLAKHKVWRAARAERLNFADRLRRLLVDVPAHVFKDNPITPVPPAIIEAPISFYNNRQPAVKDRLDKPIGRQRLEVKRLSWDKQAVERRAAKPLTPAQYLVQQRKHLAFLRKLDMGPI